MGSILDEREGELKRMVIFFYNNNLLGNYGAKNTNKKGLHFWCKPFLNNCSNEVLKINN
jgi:hypothetical protein